MLFCILAVTYAAPKDYDFKAIEENEIPVKKVKGVSAEFGGYRASAGLGGLENGGGLFAKAEAPGAGANAGIYGGTVGAGSGASAVSASEYGSYGINQPPYGVNHPPSAGGFFDRIFAIPINVLHSVNSYVQTKNGPRRVHVHHGDGPENIGPGVGVSVEAGAGVGAEAGVGAGGVGASAGIGADSGVPFRGVEAESGASASASAGSVRPNGKPDYDKIFNIPITALKSVNDFLNG